MFDKSKQSKPLNSSSGSVSNPGLSLIERKRQIEILKRKAEMVILNF